MTSITSSSSSSTADKDEDKVGGPAPPHALIIGAGIAGCTLALLLKRVGVTSTIYEAYPREQACQGSGGGLQIAPNGMLVLDHLGLAGELLSRGIVCPDFAFYNQYGKRLVALPVDPYREFAQPAVMMTRATIHEVLMEAVEHEEGIKVEFDKRLVSLSGFDTEGDEGDDDSGGAVTALFEDGSSARGDLVVGADGLHSRTRAIVLGDDDPRPQFLGLMTSGGFARTDALLDLPEDQQGTAHFLCGPTGGTFGYCRVRADDPRLVMWWRNMYVGDHPEWCERAPTRDELQAIDTDELKARILDVPGGWSPLARQLVTETEHILRGTVHDVAALPRWFAGRAVLIGDAAHAVSPHSGQGASLALEDAMYLAKMIRLALRDHRATVLADSGGDDGQRRLSAKTVPKAVFESAFRAFEAGRKARAEMVAAEGRRRGEPRAVKAGEQPPGAIRQWLTEKMLVAVFKLLVPSSFKTAFGYRIGWDDCESLADAEQRSKGSTSWWPWQTA